MDDGWGSDEWVYRSPCYRALNLSFGVRSTEPEVGAYLDRVLSALRCGDEGEAPDVWYSITHGNTDPEGTTTLHFGSELVVRAHSTAFAIETMLWHLNGATEDRAEPFVVLHAAGVALDGAGAIISGPSGAGKTTLTAALVRAGFGYLTDEALAIDPGSGLLQPYPKALSIKKGSWELLPDLRPPPSDLSPRVWHVAPTDIRPDAVAGPTPPSLVLLLSPSGPDEEANGPGMQEVRRAEALVELFRQSFRSSEPPQALRVLADAVEKMCLLPRVGHASRRHGRSCHRTDGAALAARRERNPAAQTLILTFSDFSDVLAETSTSPR